MVVVTPETMREERVYARDLLLLVRTNSAFMLGCKNGEKHLTSMLQADIAVAQQDEQAYSKPYDSMQQLSTSAALLSQQPQLASLQATIKNGPPPPPMQAPTLPPALQMSFTAAPTTEQGKKNNLDIDSPLP